VNDEIQRILGGGELTTECDRAYKTKLKAYFPLLNTSCDYLKFPNRWIRLNSPGDFDLIKDFIRFLSLTTHN
jgi:hypothetical protein